MLCCLGCLLLLFETDVYFSYITFTIESRLLIICGTFVAPVNCLCYKILVISKTCDICRLQYRRLGGFCYGILISSVIEPCLPPLHATWLLLLCKMLIALAILISVTTLLLLRATLLLSLRLSLPNGSYPRAGIFLASTNLQLNNTHLYL